MRPTVLILDEPTRGMEYQLKCELMIFLNEYRSRGNVVILVSHDIEMVAEHAVSIGAFLGMGDTH